MANSSLTRGNSIPSHNYAVIEIGGAQKIVQEGGHCSCRKIQVKVGSKIEFGRVLAVRNDNTLYLGTPWVPNATVQAEVLDVIMKKEVIVYKMKPKKHTRHNNGHRKLHMR